MELKILGSSSSGNCYILENEKEALLIECGLRMEKIKQGLAFKTSKVVGCIITHEHQDHCKGVKEVAAAGINIYASKGTMNAMAMENSSRANIIKVGAAYQLGGFKIMAFDVRHDAAEPVGYLIQHEETGKVLFLTDSFYSPGRFNGLNNILIEANYSQEIIDRKVAAGSSPEFLRNRIFKSHMSLDTCKGVLKANDLSYVNNIVLIHLSDSNSNAKQFQEEVTALTGKQVHIADGGIIIPFNKKPF